MKNHPFIMRVAWTGKKAAVTHRKAAEKFVFGHRPKETKGKGKDGALVVETLVGVL